MGIFLKTRIQSLCCLLLLLLLLLLTVISATASGTTAGKHTTLPMRLQVTMGVGGGATECWGAMLELKACTGEVILFFLNGGRTYLGPACCRAIRVIEHRCWPAMLSALGFTDQEGDILRGYCDAAAASPPPRPPPPSDPPALVGRRF